MNVPSISDSIYRIQKAHPWKMAILFTMALVSSMLGLSLAGNFTVTDEAWFDVQITDYDSPGEDYHGRFVIGLFGDVAPMTVMNFAAITRGYKRGNVNHLFLFVLLFFLSLKSADIYLFFNFRMQNIYHIKIGFVDFM